MTKTLCFLSGLARAQKLKVTTQIAHIVKAPQANAEVKALSMSATHQSEYPDNFENIKHVSIFAKVHLDLRNFFCNQGKK